MPNLVPVRDTAGRSGQTLNTNRVSKTYEYPEGLNLDPDSDQHRKLVNMVMDRATQAHQALADKRSEWRDIDRSLKGYVRPEFKNTAEEDREGIDQMPQLVLPFSYANLETLLTYMTTAFLQGTLFPYEPIGPEDAHKAFLLERVIQQQASKKKFGLNLHTMWRDAFSYGVGIIAPKWTKEYGTRTRVEERGIFDQIAQTLNVTERQRTTSDRTLMYEGHELMNIDPYRYLPDPNVPIHEVQKGEFVGWISRTNEMELLRRERDQQGFFNGQYVRKGLGDARSTLIIGEDMASRRRDHADNTSNYNNPVDEVWMYLDIIPSEWGLEEASRNPDTPEKWQFAVAGDEVLVSARPLRLDHNRFPVVVAAPDYDGHSVAPPSRMEIVQDLQHIIDFLYSSHLLNIRKAINDMMIVDPKLVNIHDVRDPKPGKLIRMRRMAWGQGRIDEGIKQLEVADVTKGHVEEGNYLLNVMEQTTGATDMAKGVVQNKGPRISASQSQSARQSVLSRMQKAARIMGMQAHEPLGELLAFQTQQLMEQQSWVKVVGESGREHMKTLSDRAEGGKVPVQPEEIVIPFDVNASNPSVPGSEDLETWTQLYQTVANNPQLAQEFDMVRMFKHIARQMGAKNVDDFIQRSQSPQVMRDEEVEEEVRKGNLTPAETQNGATS